MNTIIIELCKEDRARLDAILAALTNAAPAEHPVETLSEALQAPATTIPAEPEKAENGPEAPPWEEPAAPTYTQADLLAKVQQLASPAGGKRVQARDIVKQYASRVSEIPEDKIAEVMAKLIELEG